MSRRQIPTGLATAAVLATLLACASGDQGAAGDTTAAADTGAAALAAGGTSPAALECVPSGATLEEARMRPSPLGEVRFTVNGADALLCYGRPSAKGRTVMGELVPFGAPWRLGANEATVLHVSFPADIGGVAVEPGAYSLYAVPGETEWTFHVNRSAERWGIPIDEGVRGADVGTFTRPAARTPSMVEQLEFTWAPAGESAGNLVMQWENTRVEIPVQRRGS